MLSMNIVDCYKDCLLVRLVSWSEAPREMLLLAAIHFHAGQLVADLVCQTLGMGKRVRSEDQEHDLHQEDLHPGDPRDGGALLLQHHWLPACPLYPAAPVPADH